MRDRTAHVNSRENFTPEEMALTNKWIDEVLDVTEEDKKKEEEEGKETAPDLSFFRFKKFVTGNLVSNQVRHRRNAVLREEEIPSY